MSAQGKGVIRTIRRASRRLRYSLLAAVAAVALTTALTIHLTGVLDRVELVTVDTRFDIRGTQPPPDDIVVVGIDDATFDDPDVRWPFPRSWHAQVIDEVRRAGARVIAYDVQFTEPSPRGQAAQDEALFAAVERAAGRIVLATTETGPGGSTRVLGNDRFRRSLGARVGNALTPADANGVIRRLRHEVGSLKSFAVVAAELASGRRIPAEAFPQEKAWIDYHGPPNTLATESFGAVRRGEVDPEVFRDRIVVIGATAPSLQDVAATSASGEQLLSGPEIQAEAISTVLRDFPLRSASAGISLLLVALAALAPAALALRLRPLPAAAAALAVGAAYLGGAQLAFDGGLVIPVVAPLAGLAVGAAGALAAGLVVEALERQRVRDVFSHFVPESVVDDVLDRAGGEFGLGGSERVCTLLFSDLRGFTTFSESLPPDQVIEILNDYLSEMSDAILDHGGTLISFMGDGIMALFGAPLDQADHRDRAVETGLEMLERLERFNSRTGSSFRMGIGINTGPVMCGNVGSARRLEYTAIGDTVNTASRLEGMTKETGVQLHIAESTREGLTRIDNLREVGELAVRGRERRVRLWTVQTDAGEPTSTSDASAASSTPPGSPPSSSHSREASTAT